VTWNKQNRAIGGCEFLNFLFFAKFSIMCFIRGLRLFKYLVQSLSTYERKMVLISDTVSCTTGKEIIDYSKCEPDN
jgi:hypothetical protein